MALDREQILDTLLERFRTNVDGLRTTTRRLQDFDSIPKPALTIETQGEERDELGKWTIDLTIGIDVEIAESNQSPEKHLRAFIDGIDSALDAQAGERSFGYGGRTTLGLPSVESVSINGRIEIVQGIGGIGAAAIPVQIIAYEAA